MPTINRFADLHDEIADWRRDIHQHPELMFDVHRTAGLVADKLRAFGADEVVEGIGKTGVVGVIKGRDTGSGKVVGMRADMDALPILEETNAPYASQIPGKMHACGHDGHTAMLLGAARYLSETRNFDGTAVVIFQPAEEGGGGGREMVNDGMMDRFGIQEVYGMHNMPGIPVGEFAIRPGPFFAAADRFNIHLIGKGAHAAKPHDGVDTTLVAAQIIQAVQAIASRNVDPIKSAVVSITAMQTGTDAYNVIPQTVSMKGTVRTLEADVQDLVEVRFRQTVEGVAAAFGARVELDYWRDYPVVVNDTAKTVFAGDVAAQIAGEAHVDRERVQMMGAEDFSFMLNARPGAFILCGNGDTANVHHPEYDFNDDAIPHGASFWAKLTETAMPIGS